jgi:hypothetical protein
VFSAIISVSGVISTPCARSVSISASSAQGSSTTPLPITDSLPGRTMPEGSSEELVDLAVDDQRVAGIVPALEARDHVGALAQPVDDLALALVAPLGADDHHICHISLIQPGPGACRRGPENRGEL